MFHCTFSYAIDDLVWAVWEERIHGVSDVIGVHIYRGQNDFDLEVFYELRFRCPSGTFRSGFWPEQYLYACKEEAEHVVQTTKEAA